MELEKLCSLASSCEEIIILIRGNPDPDAIASAYALTKLLGEPCNNIKIVYTGEFTRPTNTQLIELLEISIEKFAQKMLRGNKKLFMVDGQPTFLRHPLEQEFDVVIDHHPVVEDFNCKYRDIRTDYGSTATIITEYFRTAEKSPDEATATALFYGIKTDTRNLTRNTSAHDVEAFRYLYEKADLEMIQEIDHRSLPLSVLNYFSLAIASKQVIGNTIFSFMGSLENPDVTVYVADLFMQVAEADWAVVACRSGEEIIITIRYTGKKGNAGKLASELFSAYGSAGGHESMARGEVRFEDIETEVESLEDKMIEQWIFNKLASRLKDLTPLQNNEAE